MAVAGTWYECDLMQTQELLGCLLVVDRTQVRAYR